MAASLWATPAKAAIVVYDLGLDFSDTINPNGVWSFAQGSTRLTHFTPVPEPSSWFFMGVGLIAVASHRKRRLGTRPIV